MRIGLAKEKAPGEMRVALLPPEVMELVRAGHEVYVEKGAGDGVYASDADYEAAGARIDADPARIYAQEVVVKLKAPQPDEFALMGRNILFCMLHTEQQPEYTEHLRARGARAVAMEAIANQYGERLIDATDITGEQGVLLAFQQHPKSPHDCRVLQLGYGRVGSSAFETASRLGANVKLLRKREYRHIRHFLEGRDMLINAISWPKYKRERREYVITRDMLPLLNRGAVVLDLSVDFPNPIETCRPTQLSNPWYVENGVKHICIYGYPGLAPISCSERYSRHIKDVLLEIASKPLSRLPKSIRRAVVDPQKVRRKAPLPQPAATPE